MISFNCLEQNNAICNVKRLFWIKKQFRIYYKISSLCKQAEAFERKTENYSIQLKYSIYVYLIAQYEALL